MDEPLTPVLIDGVLYLLTPSQLMNHQWKAQSQQAHDELLAQQLSQRLPLTENKT